MIEKIEIQSSKFFLTTYFLDFFFNGIDILGGHNLIEVVNTSHTGYLL